MSKYLIALAIAGASASVMAQPAPTPQNTASAGQAQTAKPQMIKKRICEETNDNPYSRINHVCRTIEVPAEPSRSSTATNQSAPAPNSGN